MYNKTVWVNGTAPAINSDNLNKIEQGIFDNDEAIDNLISGTTKAGHAIVADGLSSDILNGVPVPGAVILFGGDTAPTGWVECGGQALSRSTYLTLFNTIGERYGNGDGVTTFNMPDMRGMFARGWDHNRGEDPTVGRELGSRQEEEFKAHSHTSPRGTDIDSSNGVLYPRSSTTVGTVVTNESGGAETRPKNITFMYIIKV